MRFSVSSSITTLHHASIEDMRHAAARDEVIFVPPSFLMTMMTNRSWNQSEEITSGGLPILNPGGLSTHREKGPAFLPVVLAGVFVWRRQCPPDSRARLQGPVVAIALR